MLKGEYDVIISPCFGTTDKTEFNKTYCAICRHISMATNVPVYMRVTSKFVFDLLKDKYTDLLLWEDSLKFLSDEGYKRVKVIPVLMADGREYQKIENLCQSFQEKFEKITVLKPLMQRENNSLADLIAKACVEKENHRYVLIGHGSAVAQGEYERLSQILRLKNRSDISVFLLHGSEEFEPVVEYSYTFVPLMISCGHHITEVYENLKEKCSKAGISAEFKSCGLGENPDFKKLFCKDL